MIYYFRKPDKKVGLYELYKNTSLTNVGEILLCVCNSLKNVLLIQNTLINVK